MAVQVESPAPRGGRSEDLGATVEAGRATTAIRMSSDRPTSTTAVLPITPRSVSGTWWSFVIPPRSTVFRASTGSTPTRASRFGMCARCAKDRTGAADDQDAEVPLPPQGVSPRVPRTPSAGTPRYTLRSHSAQWQALDGALSFSAIESLLDGAQQNAVRRCDPQGLSKLLDGLAVPLPKTPPPRSTPPKGGRRQALVQVRKGQGSSAEACWNGTDCDAQSPDPISPPCCRQPTCGASPSTRHTIWTRAFSCELTTINCSMPD